MYVFALLTHEEKPSIDPLNLDQWHFYVVPTFKLDERTRSQHSITLPSLRTLCQEGVGYGDLAAAVERAGEEQRQPRSSMPRPG